VYNAPGLEGLYFTPEAVAGVLSGTITSWEDPAIADAQFRLHPHRPTAHRADDDGRAAGKRPGVDDLAQPGGTAAWPTGPSEVLEGGQRFASASRDAHRDGLFPGRSPSPRSPRP
jgi:hypothetical protein